MLNDLSRTIEAVIADHLDQRKHRLREAAWQRTAAGSFVGIDSAGRVEVVVSEAEPSAAGHGPNNSPLADPTTG